MWSNFAKKIKDFAEDLANPELDEEWNENQKYDSNDEYEEQEIVVNNKINYDDSIYEDDEEEQEEKKYHSTFRSQVNESSNDIALRHNYNSINSENNIIHNTFTDSKPEHITKIRSNTFDNTQSDEFSKAKQLWDAVNDISASHDSTKPNTNTFAKVEPETELLPYNTNNSLTKATSTTTKNQVLLGGDKLSRTKVVEDYYDNHNKSVNTNNNLLSPKESNNENVNNDNDNDNVLEPERNEQEHEEEEEDQYEQLQKEEQHNDETTCGINTFANIHAPIPLSFERRLPNNTVQIIAQPPIAQDEPEQLHKEELAPEQQKELQESETIQTAESKRETSNINFLPEEMEPNTIDNDSDNVVTRTEENDKINYNNNENDAGAGIGINYDKQDEFHVAIDKSKQNKENMLSCQSETENAVSPTSLLHSCHSVYCNVNHRKEFKELEHELQNHHWRESQCDLQSQIANLERANEFLRKDYTVSQQKLENANKVVDEWQSKVSSMMAEIEEQQRQQEEQEREQEEYKQQLKSQISHLEEESAAWEQECVSLTTKLEILQESIRKNTETMSDKTSKKVANIAVFTDNDNATNVTAYDEIHQNSNNNTNNRNNSDETINIVNNENDKNKELLDEKSNDNNDDTKEKNDNVDNTWAVEAMAQLQEKLEHNLKNFNIRYEQQQQKQRNDNNNRSNKTGKSKEQIEYTLYLVKLTVSEFAKARNGCNIAMEVQSQWERTYDQAKKVNATLNEDLNRAQTTINMLSSETAMKEETVAMLTNQLNSAEELLSYEREKNEENEDKVIELTNESRKWHDRVEELTQMNNELRTQLNHISTEHQETENLFAQKELELRELETNYKNLQNVLSTLREQRNEIIKTNNATMYKEIDELRNEVATLQKEKEQHSSVIDSLKTAHAKELSAKNVELAGLYKKHSELRKALDYSAKQLNGETMIDKSVISHLLVNFIHAFILGVVDGSKSEVSNKRLEADEMLKVLSGLLNWDETMQEKAGLLPGKLNPKPLQWQAKSSKGQRLSMFTSFLSKTYKKRHHMQQEQEEERRDGWQHRSNQLDNALERSTSSVTVDSDGDMTNKSLAALWVDFLLQESERQSKESNRTDVNKKDNNISNNNETYKEENSNKTKELNDSVNLNNQTLQNNVAQ